MGEILTGLLLTNLYYLKLTISRLLAIIQIIVNFLNIIVVYIYPKE